MIIAKVLDVAALWEAIWHAAVSGILVAAIVGLAVRSYARWHDLRLAGEGGRAVAHVSVAIVSVLCALAFAGYGLYLIAT